MKSMQIAEVQGNREAGLFEALIAVWDESVRTSHHFLSEQDIQQIKPYVGVALRAVEHLVVLYHSLQPQGFMGIQGDKIEMLFLSPHCMGQGWGSALIDWAVCTYGVTKVDVNEQNEQAARFYQHKGFRLMSRDEFDEQGNPFPILHLSRG